ncbi:MAG: DNA gyrase subunit A [Lentisphaeraceae bacterium]|nr:DNA gyrase subunit A [Lentisphaeraceae bacterium]
MDDDMLAISSNHDANLVSVNVDEEMKNSYIDYSMSVIVARALPDARDGFKPVHRRVLYSMYETKNFYNGPYKKCARVVGDVMGKYHPHGDASIYDTLVRMAQWFSLRVPLVDGHGNFGTIDGDSAAAARYTECRMAKVANEMLADIDKETVDFMPNYDGLEQEPRVLPSKLPNLLLNGSQGIAVGMATNIPPHNLRELCEGLIYFIDHPEASIDELMQFVKGPDFPTGAQICGRAGIEAMYKLGRGSITVRGETEILSEGKRETILITSIPYMVNKQAMITKMAELVKNGIIEGISDIRDETSLKDGIRVVIELKQNAKPASVILNQLYKHSDLQSTFGANMIALDHGRPRRMSLRDFFQCYVDHRFEVHTRRCRYELARAKERIHIVDGLLIAQDNLDEVIHIIRDSKTNEEAKSRLMTRFGFSDAQVSAILEMRLRQLTGLERDKLLAEQAALQARIAELMATLEDPAKVFALIKADLEELREAYTKPNDRLTKIIPAAGDVNLEDLIADEPCVFTLTHRGYMKRTSLAEYAAQRRGGQGKRGVAIKEEDFIERVYVPMTHDTLLFFSDRGRAYAARVFDLREAARTTAGTHVSNLLEGLQKDERIVEILPIRGFDEGREITFVLEDGTIKRTALVAFKNINRRGIIAINIEQGNALVKVALTKPGDRVFMATREGFVNCFKIDEVRLVGRNAMGVCGMRFKVPGDRVCGFAIEEPEAELLFVTENGRGKRSAFADFRETHRGSMGVIGNPRESEKNGKLVGIATVKGDETLVLLATNGLLIRTRVSEVRTMGRTAAGVNFVRLQEGASLATFSLAPAEETEEAPAPAAPEAIPAEPAPEA